MNIPTKKLKNGFEMPIFGLGTWQMGGRMEVDTTQDAENIKAIKAAIDLGITHIDTAEEYGVGHAEELVGEAIRDYDRSKLFLVSKVGWKHLKYDDVIAAAKASLKRLGTDYLDLYLVHKPNPEVPIEETMRAMDKLVEEGLIKNIGVSNFNIARMKEAQKYTKNKIVANQLHLNLIQRETERAGLINHCQQEDVMFIAWRPVQKGMLASVDNQLMQEMCEKYQKTAAQIAINWLTSQENIVTLAKTTDLQHLQENLGAVGWELEKEDVERLRKEYPGQLSVSDAVPLV